MRTQHWYNALALVERRGFTEDPAVVEVLELIARSMGKGMDSGKNAQGYGRAMTERSLSIIAGTESEADSAADDDDDEPVAPRRIAVKAAPTARTTGKGKGKGRPKAGIKCSGCGRGKTFGAFCAGCGKQF